MMAESNQRQKKIAVGKTENNSESISFQISKNALAIDPISSMWEGYYLKNVDLAMVMNIRIFEIFSIRVTLFSS